MAILGSPPSKWKINTDGDILPKKSTANLRIENALPATIFRSTAAALPDGLWRIKGQSSTLRIEVNTAIAGDFSSALSVLTLNPDNGGVEVSGPLTVGDPILWILSPDGVELRLEDDGEAVDDNGLWRIHNDAQNVDFEINTSVDGDFSTVERPLRLTFGEVHASGVLSIETSAGGDARLHFGAATSAVDTEDNSVFLDETDDRIHVRDNSSTDQTIAYLSDVEGGGNFVLVDEYITNETPSGDVDGLNADFDTAFPPESTSVHVYQNGLLQSPTDDYTLSGSTITFVAAPTTGDKIRVSYVKA